jgi:dipeptidyl aminopeptidase/acylaminoacyl peptidase
MGGSYGGYMTSWVVGHTDRFKAACSERALNEFSSMFGTSDIGHTFPKEHVGVYPWEDRQAHIDHSPLTFAPQIKTPLLILHSENDLRCPIEQAEQLYVWLKKLGKEVLFVRFPDEGHEMSRSGKPRHRIERFNILLDWFGAFLCDEPPSRHTEMGTWWARRSTS